MKDQSFRWPNYCPFCGLHTTPEESGNRQGTLACARCHAEYELKYFGTNPVGDAEQRECDETYVKHGGSLPS
jgi:hypothetical protein